MPRSSPEAAHYDFRRGKDANHSCRLNSSCRHRDICTPARPPVGWRRAGRSGRQTNPCRFHRRLGPRSFAPGDDRAPVQPAAAVRLCTRLRSALSDPALSNAGRRRKWPSPPIPQPSETDLAFQVLQAPPMQGCEYLSRRSASDVVAGARHARPHRDRAPCGRGASLPERAQPAMAARRPRDVSPCREQARPGPPFRIPGNLYSQALGPGRACSTSRWARLCKNTPGRKTEPALLSLFLPIQRATERSPLIKEMVESGEIYHPLAWSPREAYRFLQDIPIFEESGLVVRVPDWWKSSHPPRPVVNVKIDGRKGTTLECGRLARFLRQRDARRRAAHRGRARAAPRVGRRPGRAQGKVGRSRPRQAGVRRSNTGRTSSVRPAKAACRSTKGCGSLPESRRKRDAAASADQDRDWIGLTAGTALEETLRKLRAPESLASADPPGCAPSFGTISKRA